MENRLRILGIVPYEGMKRQMEQIAQKRDDLVLSVFVGDLREGASIAARYTPKDFDVIISRGGTAELIRDESIIPVVEIPLSLYDILRSVKLADNNNNKFAIVGFPAITQSALFLRDVLRYDLAIHTIHNEIEAENALKGIVNDNCNMVLCDMITNSLAQKQGIPAILITSGAESIESAIEQAVQTKRTYQRLTGRIALYKTLLDTAKNRVYAFENRDSLAFEPEPNDIPASVMERIRANIEPILMDGEKKFYVEAEGTQYGVYGRRKEINDATYAVCEVTTRKIPLALGKNGISYSNKEEAFDEFFNSFYGITQSTSAIAHSIADCVQSQQPLMILGEVGTGKGQLLRIVYAKSKWCGNPLVTIDCDKLRGKGWDFFLEHENSPLCDIGNSVYFKNIDALSESQFRELVNEIDDAQFYRRNRLYFVHSIALNEEPSGYYQFLINHYGCKVIQMPPLRCHKEDIPNLASVYISILNMELVKEIIGFEPEAMRMLQSLDWPHNYDQFKRIIHELVVVTDTPYIQAKSVHELLRKEQSLFCAPTADQGPSIDLNATLEEINLKVLKLVLAEVRGNQKAAAERLGISRTTLWRMMQKSGVSG